MAGAGGKRERRGYCGQSLRETRTTIEKEPADADVVRTGGVVQCRETPITPTIECATGVDQSLTRGKLASLDRSVEGCLAILVLGIDGAVVAQQERADVNVPGGGG